MTKKVVFYARCATSRQNQGSIETQIELGEAFVKARGWKLAATYSDTAVKGTNYPLRPGIQGLMAHMKREPIDVVLCTSIDRLSRDIADRAKILDEFRDHHVDIWTVDAGLPVIDLKMRILKQTATTSITVSAAQA